MWPALFGPGWVWGVLTALTLLSILVGFIGFLLLVLNRRSRSALEPIDQLRHRYEAGDITREEYDHLRRLQESRPA